VISLAACGGQPQAAGPPQASSAAPRPLPSGSTIAVTAFGAKGDGSTDDTAAVRAALAAAAGRPATLVFPAGTYVVADTVVPDAVSVAGVGDKSWINGRLQIGSRSRFADLRLGKDGAALRFVDGATATTFERVTFVGGGGVASGEDQGVVRFGAGRGASAITFRACTIGANSRDGNGVSIACSGRPAATYHDLVWDHCRFAGSPRMDFECIQRPDSGTVTAGYQHIDLTGCVFEPSGSEAISYDSVGPGGNSTVSGCIIKGAGWNSAFRFGQGVEFNRTVGMRFTGNTVYRCRDSMINHSGNTGVATDTVFSGNVFDSTKSFMTVATDAGTSLIAFAGVTGSTFVDNVVKSDVGSRILYLDDSSHNTFTGGQMIDVRPTAQAGPCGWITDRSSSNSFTGVRFRSAVGGSLLAFTAGADANTVARCTFVGGGQSPVTHDAGLTVTLVNNSLQ
jgi:hypothetical protein